MTIPVKQVEEKLLRALKDSGFTDTEAHTISQPILWAVLHGNNQGLLKLVNEAGLKKNTAQRPVKILHETGSSAWFDGGEHNAMLVVQTAMDKAVELASASGIAIVGTRGTHSSCGALAYFTEQAARKGLVAIMMCRTPPTVAPFGSKEAFFGTNPFAISYPTEDEPLTFDMATAAIAWYGLIQAAAEGEQVDSTKVIDALGNPTSDPSIVLKEGMVLPFDRGHKGSGIGMMVELLAGPFLGASFADGDGEWGNLILVLDPDLFAGKEAFKKSCSALINKLRNAKTACGETVRLPGDRAREFFEQVQKSGSVEISPKVLSKLGWN